MRIQNLFRAAQRDQGVALVVVIGIGMLMLMLVATSLTVAAGGLRKTDTNQDWNGALDAAYAGVEEYQSRLASDTGYYRYGNPAAPFSKAPISSSSVTLPTGSNANPAFGVGTTGTWATVPGSTPIASFRYEVDNSKYATTGSIRIRSTGRVGEVTRSVVADLKQSGFIDFLYFTDYEVQDPAQTGQSYCATHIWEGRSNYCSTIQFGSSDTIKGPVHSNDTLTICGSTFNGRVTSSNPNTPIYIKPSGCSNGNYSVGTGPVYQAGITMPPTNAELKKETRSDLTLSEVPLPGCLYTGPTVITFTSNGKMNISSPWTVSDELHRARAREAPRRSADSRAQNSGQLGSSGGATIDVIAVERDLRAERADAEQRSQLLDQRHRTSFKCVNSNAGWTFTSVQFPASGELTPDDSSSANPAYGCRNGDLFVQGTLKGALTMARRELHLHHGRSRLRRPGDGHSRPRRQRRSVGLESDDDEEQQDSPDAHRLVAHDQRGDPVGCAHVPGSELQLG